MVGDTLHTDILGGNAAGFRTALIAGYGFFDRRRSHHAAIAESGILFRISFSTGPEHNHTQLLNNSCPGIPARSIVLHPVLTHIKAGKHPARYSCFSF
jgi:hypothetical protein